jgi:hypothetical protein
MLAARVEQLRHAVHSRRFWLYVVVTFAGIGVGVAIALASRGTGKKPSSNAATATVVSQHATATAGGISIAMTSARFSGTETVVTLAVKPQRASDGKVPGVTLTPDAIGYSWRQTNAAGAAHAPPVIAVASVRAQVRAEPRKREDTGSWLFVLDLGPVHGPGSYQVTVSHVAIAEGDEPSHLVTGPWTLSLSAPADVQSSLMTQALEPAEPAAADGITVTVESAVRSDSETLVELKSEGAFGAVFLAPPTITASGNTYTGRLIPFGPGSTMIYTFPAIPARVSASLVLHNAVAPQSGVTDYFSYVDVDRAMLNAGLAGSPGDRVPLSSDGVLATPGAPVASAVEFRPSGVAVVTLARPLLIGQTGVTGSVDMTLPDGSAIPSDPLSTQSSSPAPDQGVSQLTFHVGDAQLHGIVCLSIGKSPAVHSGPWTIQLNPS